ncbi:glycosyltransferase family 39 protein [Actinomadura sp. LOL_016]|uniref:glycosyltransferase family 39 protein n=1 Tax=unclassified Actinomadura TaxID=2626254 RepID=UPI003A7FF3B7
MTAAEATIEEAPERTAPFVRHRWAAPALAACTALAVSLVGISGASFWLDEAATISVVTRPWPDLLRFLEGRDAVHGIYYVLMHFVAEVLGTSEFAMRLPSALAATAAAALVTVLGRRFADPLTGLLAGLFYATGVTTTQYAQEARPYAFTAVAATAATYAFARMLETRALRWPVVYVLAIVLLGLFNVFALLLVPAHALTFFLLRSTGGRGSLVRWLCASGAAGLLLAPFVVFVADQKTQVSWIPPLSDNVLRHTAAFLAGDERLVVLVAVLAGLGATAPTPLGARVPMRELIVPWTVLPLAALLAVSLVDPVFRARYVYFSMPAIALMAGAALAWLARQRKQFLVAALVPLVVLTVPAQAAIREHDSKAEDLRALARILDEHARPGDGVLYLDQVSRWESEAYPEAYRGLVDTTLDKDAAEAANLVGIPLHSASAIADRLRGTRRIWLVDRKHNDSPPEAVQTRHAALESAGPYSQEKTWRYKSGSVTLLVRTTQQQPLRAPANARGQ